MPFSPAAINTAPSHRIRLYANEKAMPLKAREAIRGSPSPWKVFAMMPMQAREREERERTSVLLSVVVVVVMVVGRETFGCHVGENNFCRSNELIFFAVR